MKPRREGEETVQERNEERNTREDGAKQEKEKEERQKYQNKSHEGSKMDVKEERRITKSRAVLPY